MKKKLFYATILIAILVLGIPVSLAMSYAHIEEVIESKIILEQFHNNANRSIELAQDVLREFRSSRDMGEFNNNNSTYNHKEAVTYNDDFAGIFIDDYGVLNVGVVASDRQIIQLNSMQNYDGQIIYRNQRYALNHLMKIKETIVSEIFCSDIFIVSIDEKLNRVDIYLGKEKTVNSIIDFLQRRGLYSSYAVNFTVDPNRRPIPRSNTIYGGSTISSNSFIRRVGTTTANAICNDTGQLGILTNHHVARTDNVSRGSSGLLTTIGRYRKSYLRNHGTIDASFIPFANQNNWAETAYAINGYTNIRMGGEHLIIQGAPVKQIGNASGVTIGVIQARSTYSRSIDFYSGRKSLRNIIRTNNLSRDSDSGGPLYFYGGGQNLFLIGMKFAGCDFWSYACRITEVERLLNVRVITNDTQTHMMRPGLYTMPPVYRNQSNHEMGTDIHLHGNNNRLSIFFGISNNTTKILDIAGNGTSTTFLTNVPEWSVFNSTIVNASFIRLGVWHDHVTIQVADTEGNQIWFNSFSIPSNFRIVSVCLDVLQSNQHNRIFGNITSYSLTFITMTNAAQLSNIRNNTFANFRLARDIDLNGQQWIPIPEFHGVLDGNGFSIRGFSYTRTNTNQINANQYIGLIANLHGIVRSLTIFNSSIYIGDNHSGVGWIRAGLAAGFVSERGTIYNVVIYSNSMVTVQRYRSSIGLIAGYSRGVIRNSIVLGADISIQGSGYMGAVVGMAYGDISGNHIVATAGYIVLRYTRVNADRSIGGIVGFKDGDFLFANHVNDLRIERTDNIGWPHIGSVAGRLGSVHMGNRAANSHMILADGRQVLLPLIGWFNIVWGKCGI